MESNWAAEHLQVIRTLMERSAVYRHALAPIMIFLGALGLSAAAAGMLLKIQDAFIGYWLAVAIVAVAGAFLIARRQALKDAEPFWSPPMRRITQAVLPALAAGLLFSSFLFVFRTGVGEMRWIFIFPNIFFYACAFHAAGFFMPRGMKLFAWILMLLAAGTLFVLPAVQTDPNVAVDHALMGFFFGALHLAYGVYLYFTEKGKNAA
jgi:hypothetical protein